MKPDELPIDPDLDPDDPAEPHVDEPFVSPATAATSRASVERRGRWDVVAVIALGGALGTLARAVLGQLFPTPLGRFPATTLTINLVGAFLLGVLIVVLIERFGPTPRLRPFLVTGVLGGFTTFSTFMVEAIRLGQARHATAAVVYLGVSTFGGLCVAFLGILVGQAVVGYLSDDADARVVTVEEIGDGS